MSNTVAGVLHTLLRVQTSRQSTQSAYLHPHAPWKGKGAHVALDAQLELVRAVRAALAGAAPLLLAPEHQDRLLRALREVVAHQANLLPLATMLYSLDTSRQLAATARLAALPPVDMLTALAQSLGIESYLEDSQFGLLKTSVALAGARFVVDIDLETDAAAGDEEHDVPDEDARVGRGQVRLAKLTVNHVGPSTGGSGASARSAWLEQVLRARVEACLGGPTEAAVDALRVELADVKALDGVAATAQDVDYYADLEIIARGVQERLADGPGSCSTFPTFRLLETTGPALRVRPATAGEHVPPLEDTLEDSAVRSMWVIEIVGSMSVRSGWMGGPLSAESSTRIESLLYGTPFPYMADFAHRPAQALQQHWSMAQPGPDGYVLGRIGLSTWDAFDRLVTALRSQAVVNALFASAIAPHFMAPADDDSDAGGDDGDLGMSGGGARGQHVGQRTMPIDDDDNATDRDDAMDGSTGPSGAIALSLTAQADGLCVLMPVDDGARDVEVRVRAVDATPYREVSCDDAGMGKAVAAAAEGGLDLVQILRLFTGVSHRT